MLGVGQRETDSTKTELSPRPTGAGNGPDRTNGKAAKYTTSREKEDKDGKIYP